MGKCSFFEKVMKLEIAKIVDKIAERAHSSKYLRIS